MYVFTLNAATHNFANHSPVDSFKHSTRAYSFGNL